MPNQPVCAKFCSKCNCRIRWQHFRGRSPGVNEVNYAQHPGRGRRCSEGALPLAPGQSFPGGLPLLAPPRGRLGVRCLHENHPGQAAVRRRDPRRGRGSPASCGPRAGGAAGSPLGPRGCGRRRADPEVTGPRGGAPGGGGARPPCGVTIGQRLSPTGSRCDAGRVPCSLLVGSALTSSSAARRLAGGGCSAMRAGGRGGAVPAAAGAGDGAARAALRGRGGRRYRGPQGLDRAGRAAPGAAPGPAQRLLPAGWSRSTRRCWGRVGPPSGAGLRRRRPGRAKAAGPCSGFPGVGARAPDSAPGPAAPLGRAVPPRGVLRARELQPGLGPAGSPRPLPGQRGLSRSHRRVRAAPSRLPRSSGRPPGAGRAPGRALPAAAAAGGADPRPCPRQLGCEQKLNPGEECCRPGGLEQQVLYVFIRLYFHGCMLSVGKDFFAGGLLCSFFLLSSATGSCSTPHF